MIALKLGNLQMLCMFYFFSIFLALSSIPQQIQLLLKNITDKVIDAAKVFRFAHNFLYLGRGFNFPVALEGALKLKEISYV
eukprot:GSMAST32.ASY1.ANO1.1764.1 assembled CDS